MMRIELDSVRKHRNANEYRPINRARCMGIEEAGDHSVIVSLAKRLVAEGHSGPVEVWRNGTLCFAAKDVAEWASGKALTGEQPAHLRRKEAAQ
jgi:hypothetical protein